MRALAIVSRNDIAAIDHALPAHQLRNAVIKGTMSAALRLGHAEQARAPRGDEQHRILG